MTAHFGPKKYIHAIGFQVQKKANIVIIFFRECVTRCFL